MMFPAEQVLEGPLWDALWPFMCVLGILQLRVAAQIWTDASRYGPNCEMLLGQFFFFSVGLGFCFSSVLFFQQGQFFFYPGFFF